MIAGLTDVFLQFPKIDIEGDSLVVTTKARVQIGNLIGIKKK